MKVLDESDYIEKLNSYTLSDWKPLLNMIPRIESQIKFGIAKGGEMVDVDTITISIYIESGIIEEFRDVVYAIPIMIGFDWGGWSEGRKIVSDENYDYDSVDIPTKCKIITAIVRNDRFCDGALLSAFERGLILKVLKSIEKQLYLNQGRVAGEG